MRKIKLILLTMILTICTTYNVVCADYETWYVGANSGLNCRTAPTTTADILITYPRGQALQIIGVDNSGEWWETWDGVYQGWCYSRYLVSDLNETSASSGTYLGRFKITHYCPNNCCNGGYGNNTAWAGEIIPGQTIAVDPSVIGKLQWVNIDGYGLRRAEDCGGGVKGNHIDVAVPTHKMAEDMGVVYRDVYLAEE